MKWIFVNINQRGLKSGAVHLVGGCPGWVTQYTSYSSDDSAKIWVQKDEEVFMWKEFQDIPISLEFNINF